MADPAAITPDGLEVLVARDLRKAGIEPGRIRRGDPRPLDEAGQPDAYRLDLSADLRSPVATPIRIACQVGAPVEAEALRAFAEGEGDEARASGRRPRQRPRPEPAREGVVVVATAGFSRAALAAAGEVGVLTLRVADARAAYDASGWGPAGQYPIWLPEYVLELAELGPSGQPRYEALTAGMAERLLRRMRLRPA